MAGVFDFLKKTNHTQEPTHASSQTVPTTDQPVSAPNSPSMNNAGAPQQSDRTVPVSDSSHNEQGTSQPATLNPQPIGAPQTGQKKIEELDLMTHLTQRSNRVFVAAQNKAKELQNSFVDSEHLLYGLLTDPEIYKLITEQKIVPQLIQDELTKNYKKENATTAPQFSPRIKRILDNSLIIARKLGFDFISPEHILIAEYEEGEGVGARILAQVGLKKEELNKKVIGKKEGFNPAEEEKKESVLESFTKDLTAKASQGLLDPVVERSDVIERAIHILSRRTKNNPALVGEAGVGKTAIVEGLAQKIVSKEVPESLLNKRILELDLMSMIAGASHRGEFEERMKELIEEITKSKGSIILFIDEIHNLVGAGGGEGSLDASNFLKPSLARGELQVIGATTLTEYRKYIEKDPALERRFQPVLVPEPTEEQAIKMLKAVRDKYEAFHRVKIPDNAIDTAVKLSKRYIGDRFLPDKAVDLIDEAAAAVRLPLISLPEEIRSLEERISGLTQEATEAEKSGNRVRNSILQPKIQDIKDNLSRKQEEYNLKKGQTTTVLTEQVIKDVVARWTGIPVSKITASEGEKLAKLEDIMHQRMIGQTTAVTAVAQAVRRGRAGLKATQKPIGSFVFMGPTGVGKTELAKTLADILFGTEESIIRLDMTEYMEKHEVAKLLGAPPGYVGYDEGGKLTEAVRRKPYSVVLFDEVEKAHPDIFNILLQILDDGRLTDNKGHTVSFKNTVVICTSNIGGALIQDEILKSGKMEIEEPTVLSTYTFSPRGREIMTMISKAFERETSQQPWKDENLNDYFAGQQLQSDAEHHDKVEFPIHGIDTHTMSAKGVEMITHLNILYYRTSTTTKTWSVANLIEYFKDGVVINALPDSPEQQLPTSKLKTHCFTNDEREIVTYKDRFWMRQEASNDWTTGELKDYFQKQTMKDGHAFPINYWDIHTFAPNGDESIIVGDQIWHRPAAETVWTTSSLHEYFGKDFPLDKKVEEKKTMENELEKNQYNIIKEKVLVELRKFFRPELINRFDEVIIFEPLRYEHMNQIVELQMKSLKKLLEDQEIGFDYSKGAVKEITRVGFDPIYGARPLKRAIQKLIENPISTLIIEQKAVSGDKIIVDFDGENFIFNIEKVEMVEKASLPETVNLTCDNCHTSFSTLEVRNSTIICPSCSKKLEKKAETKPVDTDVVPKPLTDYPTTQTEHTDGSVQQQVAHTP